MNNKRYFQYNLPNSNHYVVTNHSDRQVVIYDDDKETHVVLTYGQFFDMCRLVWKDVISLFRPEKAFTEGNR
tara:strand:+ start:52 stop:267 length:216 start_codon:yes stop_codon:yes gene_type:complete